MPEQIDSPFTPEEVVSAMRGVFLSFITFEEDNRPTWHKKVVNEISPTQTAIPFYKKGNIPGKDQPAGYVIDTGSEILVCYRGTANTSEIISDISARPATISFGENAAHVHAGFKYEFKQSEESMNKAIIEARKRSGNNNASITFAGHSMGAAVAQIAALKHKALNPKTKTRVITLGGPRVLCNDAAKLYDNLLGETTLRIRQEGDKIIQLPPEGIFKHAGFHKITTNIQGSEMHTPNSYLSICKEKIDQTSLKEAAYRAELLKTRKDLKLIRSTIKGDLMEERGKRFSSAASQLARLNPKKALRILNNSDDRQTILEREGDLTRSLGINKKSYKNSQSGAYR